MGWKKNFKRLIVIAILGGCVAGGVFWWRQDKADSTPSTAPELTTAKVERGPIRQAVRCTGRIASNRDIEIKCRASGQVINVPFDVSQPVKVGDLLLELDTTEQQRLVDQANATLRASEARLAQARANLLSAEANLVATKQKTQAALTSSKARADDLAAKAKREQQLLEKKMSSPEEAETMRTSAVQAEQEVQTAEAALEDIKAAELALKAREQDIKMNEAQLDSNAIALKLATNNLGYTKVFSPVDGVVSARNVQVGQIIASGISNVGGGTSVLTISDLSHMYILASVDESNIGYVKVDQPVEVTADSFPRVKFKGRVDRIATKGVNVSNVVTFEVRIEVTSENKTLLKPEMTSNVAILVAEKKDTLLVPAAAVSRDREQTVVTLQTADGKNEENHPVELGVSNDMQTEIVAGLKEGDVVVLQRPEDDSRWRANDAGGDDRRRRMMMMRTMGGGGGPMGGPRGGR